MPVTKNMKFELQYWSVSIESAETMICMRIHAQTWIQILIDEISAWGINAGMPAKLQMNFDKAAGLFFQMLLKKVYHFKIVAFACQVHGAEAFVG